MQMDGKKKQLFFHFRKKIIYLHGKDYNIMA